MPWAESNQESLWPHNGRRRNGLLLVISRDGYTSTRPNKATAPPGTEHLDKVSQQAGHDGMHWFLSEFVELTSSLR